MSCERLDNRLCSILRVASIYGVIITLVHIGFSIILHLSDFVKYDLLTMALFGLAMSINRYTDTYIPCRDAINTEARPLISYF